MGESVPQEGTVISYQMNVSQCVTTSWSMRVKQKSFCPKSIQYDMSTADARRNDRQFCLMLSCSEKRASFCSSSSPLAASGSDGIITMRVYDYYCSNMRSFHHIIVSQETDRPKSDGMPSMSGSCRLADCGHAVGKSC